jgi:hypothetical protein
MISIVIIPTNTKVVIEIPEEMLNKPIHVDIHAESEDERSFPEPDPEKLKEVKACLERFQINLSNFKFDREAVYERWY